MRPRLAILPTAARCLFAVVLASCLSAFAPRSFATEDQAPPGDSFLARRPATAVSFPRLSRLQNWADEEKDKDNSEAAGKSGDKEGADKNGDKEEDEDAEEEKPLESDRPDFTESSSTVGDKVLQIESGYTYTHAIAGAPAVDEHDLPELLVRYGVAERLELRLEWEGWLFDHSSDRTAAGSQDVNGSSDTEFGFKYALTKQQKWRPQAAVLVGVTAPVGAPAFSSRQVDARIAYLYSWELTKKLSLACSTGNLWTGETDDRFSYLYQSASLDYELTERLHCFNEFYAWFRRDSLDNRTQSYYNGGLTFLVTKNFQVDWRAGWGLNDASDRFFTGCGLTIRK